MRSLLIISGLFLSSALFGAATTKVGGSGGTKVGGSGATQVQATASGAVPTYTGQAATYNITADTSTTTITISTEIPAGSRIMVYGMWSIVGQTLTSVTDSDSNTYTVHQTQAATIGGLATNTFVASANASAILSTSNTIVLNWGTPDFGYRFGRVFYAANCATSGQPDTSQKATAASGTSVGQDGTTTVATTGISMVVKDGSTYSSAAWTAIGNELIDGTFRVAYNRSDMASAGTQNPALVFVGSSEWSLVWAAFK